jgi:hypothetical protein
MPRRNVNGESLRMKKRLLTEGTLEREIAFVLLHMIVHGVLFVFRDDFPTIWADKIPVGISLICVCHAYGLHTLWPTVISIFRDMVLE